MVPRNGRSDCDGTPGAAAVEGRGVHGHHRDALPPPRRRSMTIPKTFKAFRIHSDKSGYRRGIERVSLDDLAPGEIVTRSPYPLVNSKDSLPGTGKDGTLPRLPP